MSTSLLINPKMGMAVITDEELAETLLLANSYVTLGGLEVVEYTPLNLERFGNPRHVRAEFHGSMVMLGQCFQYMLPSLSIDEEIAELLHS